MEAVAVFVFARGGAARPDEIEDLFREWPEVRAGVLAGAVSLKKAVGRAGAAHGLVWCDAHPLERGPVVVHEITDAQRDGGAQTFTEASKQVPHALAALETFMRMWPARELRSGALSDFYNAFPRESAFMRRRSGGVVAFVRQYDPVQRRFRWDDCEGLYVQSRESEADDDEHPLMSEAQLLSVAQGQTDKSPAYVDKKPPACQPVPEPESALAARPSKGGGWSEHSLQICGVVALTGEKSQDELREATISIHAAPPVAERLTAKRLAGDPPSRSDAIKCVLWFPRLVSVVERVNAVLANARATPRLHPFEFRVVVFERCVRSREAWRAARRIARRRAATQASSLLELCLRGDLDQAVSDDVREQAVLAAPSISRRADPAVASLVLSDARGIDAVAICSTATQAATVEVVLATSDRTIRVALGMLLRVNVVLRQAAQPPAPHPLVIKIIEWIRMDQSERAKRAVKRSTALSKALCNAMTFLVIPRATREHLSFAASSAVATAPNRSWKTTKTTVK